MRLIAISLCAFLSLGALAEEFADVVDARAFFTEIQGRYQIDLAGGEKPKETNSLGSVELDTPEAIVTLPYCLPGQCDPGYVFFPYAKTTVTKEAADGGTLFTLVVTDGTTSRYAWFEKAGVVTFRNYQYALTPSETVTLEHVIRKLSE